MLRGESNMLYEIGVKNRDKQTISGSVTVKKENEKIENDLKKLNSDIVKKITSK